MLTNIMEKRKKYLEDKSYFIYSDIYNIEYPCNQYTKIRYWYRFLYQKIKFKFKSNLKKVLG